MSNSTGSQLLFPPDYNSGSSEKELSFLELRFLIYKIRMMLVLNRELWEVSKSRKSIQHTIMQ